MKKGIILERHRKYTILMTKDGAFLKGKVYVKDAQIGDEVVFEPIYPKRFFFLSKNNKRHLPARILTVACIVLVCLFLPFYFSPNDKTYAYVTVDINPSIELEVDENYTVRKIHAMNDDAEQIMGELTNYLNKNLETVIQMIMNTSEENGLINNGKNILVGISYMDEEKTDDEQKILKEIENHFEENKPDWNLAAFNVPKDIRDLADEQKTSMNKLMAKQLIIGQEPKSIQSLQNEDFLDISEVEIMDTFFKSTDNVEEKTDEEEIVNEEEPQEDHEKEIQNDENVEMNDDINDETNEEVNTPNPPQESEVEEHTETNEEENIPTDEDSKEDPHPSELKGKNGEINSNGNNIKKNSDHHPSQNKKDNDHAKWKDENHPSNQKGKNGNNE